LANKKFVQCLQAATKRETKGKERGGLSRGTRFAIAKKKAKKQGKEKKTSIGNDSCACGDVLQKKYEKKGRSMGKREKKGVVNAGIRRNPRSQKTEKLVSYAKSRYISTIRARNSNAWRVSLMKAHQRRRISRKTKDDRYQQTMGAIKKN